MPAVVTQASTVSCGHGGIVQTVGSPKLTVGGSPVLVDTGIIGKPIPAPPAPKSCSIVPPPNSNVPCTSVLAVNPPSLATKLVVGARPVVLASLSGTTNGSVPTLLTAVVTQTLLTTV